MLDIATTVTKRRYVYEQAISFSGANQKGEIKANTVSQRSLQFVGYKLLKCKPKAGK